LYIFLVSPCS